MNAKLPLAKVPSSLDKARSPWLVLVILLCAAGCFLHNPNRVPVVTPVPVVFAHPEEVRVGDGFMVLADRRVFVTMAFLNATGFDRQPEGVPMHPVRQKTRQRVAENLAACPEKVEKWRQYVKSRDLGTFCYQDFALSLQADYPFQRIRPDKELGYPNTAGSLRDFPEVLRDFWITGDLTNIWNEVRGDYLAELDKYDFATMTEQMSSLWKYLRMPRRDTLSLVNVPDLLDEHYSAIGARYESRYYCVESPGSYSYGLNVHEYLHSIVNPVVTSNFSAHREKLLCYYEAGRQGPFFATYRQPVVFTCECLVRALDHRFIVLSHMNATNAPLIIRAQASQVAGETAKGLTLTRPFYEALQEYEASSESFDVFLPNMLTRLPENPSELNESYERNLY